MSDAREEQIRQRAYAIWESSGCPEGQDCAHWEQASREIEQGSIDGAGAGASSDISMAAGSERATGKGSRGARVRSKEAA